MRVLFLGLSLSLFLPFAAWAQESVGERLLFDADSRSFVILDDFGARDASAEHLTGWEAEGIDADTALTLAGLLSTPDALSEEDAQSLQDLTTSLHILPGQVYVEPVGVVIPDIDPPSGGGDPLWQTPEPPTCRNGRILPYLCQDPENSNLRICSCD